MPSKTTRAAKTGAPDPTPSASVRADSPPSAPARPGAAALSALCADTTDYRHAATDLEFFGRYYLPHYFSLPAPAFHRELDAHWRDRIM